MRPTVGERRLEVGRPGPVRRPDLDQPRAGAPDDLGDPHAAADLDQLAARHDDAAAAPGQPDREGERRRVVVGDERILGAGQGDEVVLGDPRSAAPRRPVVAVHLEQQRSRCATAAAAATAAAGHGARPRFVWMITPVALMSRREARIGRIRRGGRRRVVGERRPASRGSAPAASRARSSSTTARATARERAGARVAIRRRGRSAAQHGVDARADAGGRPASTSSVPPWRERVGVEPTTPRRARRHRF